MRNQRGRPHSVPVDIDEARAPTPPQTADEDRALSLALEVGQAVARELARALTPVRPQLVVEQIADDYATPTERIPPGGTRTVLPAHPDRRAAILKVPSTSPGVSIVHGDDEAGFPLDSGERITVTSRAEYRARNDHATDNAIVHAYTEFGLDDAAGV